MERARLDRLDYQLLQALAIDGRASFSCLGAVLGASDQTVARRYRRLRDGGVARVRGLVDRATIGRGEWALRITCDPDAAAPVARALARHRDTLWVQLAAGGSEILCGAHAGPESGDTAPLVDHLASTRRVVRVSAHRVLHRFRFRGRPARWPAGPHALGDEQLQLLLGDASPPTPDAPVALRIGDRGLLAALAHDGRVSNTRLAALVGAHESTVRRRIEQLRAGGSLYFDLDVDERHLGSFMKTALWISVAPAHLTRVGTLLARHDQVVYAAATTGPTNLLATVLCRDTEALHDYLSTEVAALPAVDRIETMPIRQTIKRATPPGRRAPDGPVD